MDVFLRKRYFKYRKRCFKYLPSPFQPTKYRLCQTALKTVIVHALYVWKGWSNEELNNFGDLTICAECLRIILGLTYVLTIHFSAVVIKEIDNFYQVYRYEYDIVVSILRRKPLRNHASGVT